MLTKTKLIPLAEAELREAKTGTTFEALLRLIGESNREWLYGWLNGQRRCRPPCVVLRADGKYIRPQYIPAPADTATTPPRDSRAKTLRLPRAVITRMTQERYREVLRLYEEQGVTCEEISRKYRLSRSGGWRLLSAARKWRREGRL